MAPVEVIAMVALTEDAEPMQWISVPPFGMAVTDGRGVVVGVTVVVAAGAVVVGAAVVGATVTAVVAGWPARVVTVAPLPEPLPLAAATVVVAPADPVAAPDGPVAAPADVVVGAAPATVVVDDAPGAVIVVSVPASEVAVPGADWSPTADPGGIEPPRTEVPVPLTEPAPPGTAVVVALASTVGFDDPHEMRTAIPIEADARSARRRRVPVDLPGTESRGADVRRGPA